MAENNLFFNITIMAVIKNMYRDTLAHEIKSIRKLTHVDNKQELLDTIMAKVHSSEMYNTEKKVVRDQQEKIKQEREFETIFSKKNAHELIYLNTKQSESDDTISKIYFCLKNKGSFGFSLLKEIENKLLRSPGVEIEINLINDFDEKGNSIRSELLIPFTGIPPTDSQNKYDVTISQLLDPKVDSKYAHKFGNFNTYSGNSGYFYQRILKEIRDNNCSLVDEWANYIITNQEKSGFFYRKYTTYGDLYDMDHNDPDSKKEVFFDLFNEFLQQKKIKLCIDKKEISRNDLRSLYVLNTKQNLE